MFYEKWVKQLDANLSPILAAYDAHRHRALRILLRPVFPVGGDKAVHERVLVNGQGSRSCDFKTTLLKAMISKIALYNPGTYDVVAVSWDSKGDSATAIGAAEFSAESFSTRNNTKP